jgi:hypothetical protein
MKKISRTILAASMSLALAACNNGDKKETPAPTPTAPAQINISGSVFKGALISAKVQIYRASDIEFLSPLTTTPEDVQTNDNGDYSATIVNANGDILVGAIVVKFTTDANTQMRCDAAVSCGDVLRGELIPTLKIAGLSLTTLTVATVKVDGTSNDIVADANTLTTMATDAVLAQVAANPNLVLAIDTLPIEDVTALQQNASVVVGEILGVDLSETNIYDITIVDSTDTQGVADAELTGTDPSITNTLTLINASLAAITIPAESTLAEVINDYVQTVAVVANTVVEALAEGVDIATALADPATVDAQVALAEAQVEISDQVTLIQATVEADAANEGIAVVIEVVVVPVVVQPIEVELGNGVITVTGGTGATDD